MKTLELNEMENIEAGNCGAALILGGIGLGLAVFAPWSYAMIAGVAVDAIGVVASCLD